jgi:hypothetical protein
MGKSLRGGWRYSTLVVNNADATCCESLYTHASEAEAMLEFVAPEPQLCPIALCLLLTVCS